MTYDDRDCVDLAVAMLDAVLLDDGTWAYYADETSSWWVVEEADFMILCDYLDDSDKSVRDNAYSHWCATIQSEEMPIGWSPY